MIEEARIALIRFGEKVLKGDAAGLATLYTEDAVLLPPNSEKIYGRKAIEEFWGGVMQMGVKDAVLETVEFFGSGDTLTEVGNYTMKIQPEGQKPIEYKDKYIIVWKQTDEGLKLHRDIWNSNFSTP